MLYYIYLSLTIYARRGVPMYPIGKKNVERFVVLTVSIQQDGDKWLARCIELGTSTFSNTFEGAREALDEAIELHLNTLEDVHECERFLKENGVIVYTNTPHPPTLRRKVDIEPGVFMTRNITKIPASHFC
jgi:predicted RNase H-like HicB family nuclease